MKNEKELADVGLSIKVTRSLHDKLKELCQKECRSQAEQITYLILKAYSEIK